MNRRLHSHVRERLDPRGLTPGTIAHGAQIAVLAIGAMAVHGYLGGGLNDGDAGQLALAMGVAVLMAAPRQRGAELLGAVAIWLTTCEFMAASRTGQFALWRWAEALAALALILIMTHVPHFRALARANPWRSLRDRDRRHARGGPGAAWRHRAEGDHVPAALADIEGQARRIGS
jgi:hypothetical protein